MVAITMKIFVYGPPGSGKSSTGRCLSENLALPFYDLDREIEATQTRSIPEIFAGPGEGAFRSAEKNELNRFIDSPEGFVLALGAGALLDEDSHRKARAAGKVICLVALPEVLLERLQAEADRRPLLSGDVTSRLDALLLSRAEHYASFPVQVDTSHLSPQAAAWQAQVKAGVFYVHGMGRPYPVLVLQEEPEAVGSMLTRSNLEGPIAMVSDQNVAGQYEELFLSALRQAGYSCHSIVLPPGESSKTLATVAHLWDAFLEAGLDRKSSVLALGGGVITDLAGFAAAAYLRGVRWAAVPTTLLGMVDASLGGKTGIDLPRGKNLAGAFHAPELVLSFPKLLAPLPEAEIRNGLAEVVKHGLIADPDLFRECALGWDALVSRASSSDWANLVSRAVAVKIRILCEDPYEQGRRAVLNFGHTFGHAIEQASGYRLRHGEAVAIGMVVEARMGEKLGITRTGVAEAIGEALEGLGLPARIPSGLDPAVIRRSLRVDKKNQSGKARLSLPVQIGDVQFGYEIEEEKLWSLFWSCMDRI
jgi:shikimate kinase / 3-dehydroquinate synthase